MGETDNSERKKLEACQRLWGAHRTILQMRAINLDKVSAEWASRESLRLASPGARDDFEELCQQGCVPQILAAIVFLFRSRPFLEEFWEQILGSPTDRERTTRALERMIATLEGGFANLMVAEDEEIRERFNAVGQLSVSELVSGLPFYVDLMNFDEVFTAQTQARSLTEVTKYLLAGYVKRATGRFCDQNVSGLLAEIVGPLAFNEVAQRMWRSRNYPRLDKHFQKAAELCYFMGLAITRPA